MQEILGAGDGSAKVSPEIFYTFRTLILVVDWKVKQILREDTKAGIFILIYLPVLKEGILENKKCHMLL